MKAARSHAIPFKLTARAENLIYGRSDMNDTIRRLRAYALAGADVLFAPGLKTREEIMAVVTALAPAPLSVVMGLSGTAFSLPELAAMGVKRVSLGESLARAAYGAFISAATEIKEEGRFTFANHTISFSAINASYESLMKFIDSPIKK